MSWIGTGLALLALCTNEANARCVQILTYEEMASRADLIVVATPVATMLLNEREHLQYCSNNVTLEPYVGVMTTLKVEVTLKGSVDSTGTVKLHHFAYETRPWADTTGFSFVSFNLGEKVLYLLFLAREASGDMRPVTDQTDAGDSIFPLGRTRAGWR